MAIKTPSRIVAILVHGRPTAMSEEVKPTEEVQVEVRADGPAVAKMRANGILKTEKDELGYLKNDDYGLVSGFGERMDAMKEIKATDFAPGVSCSAIRCDV